MRNSELVKPCREQLSYQGKKDHGPSKVCKLTLIRLELCSKRLEHYYVFICTYFYLFCHLFFCKFHLKEENFNRMMCEHRQQHDVFGRTENPSNHWEGTRKPSSNITIWPNVFRLRTASQHNFNYFNYLINEQPCLLIFKILLPLLAQNSSCWFIDFPKYFHHTRLLDWALSVFTTFLFEFHLNQ